MRAINQLRQVLAGSIVLLTLASPRSLAGQPSRVSPKAYPLWTWNNDMCRAKGRFQDQSYCVSAVIDQIVADGKTAIPVLISQITDTRLISRPVYDFWPRIQTGELAILVLNDLFLDDTWMKHTMPDLFPNRLCDHDKPASDCWGEFRKAHTLREIQSRWIEFWKANQNEVYWDAKA